MGTLYVDRKNVELRVESGKIIFCKPSGRRGSIPLAHIDRVVIRGNVNLSSSVIGALGNAGAGILFLSGRYNRHLATFVGRPHNDVVRRIGQVHAYRDTDFRILWSHEIVEAKISAQIRLLTRALERRSDLRRQMYRGVDQLEQILEKINHLSKPNSIENIRGFEGAAARLYFESFRNLFANSLQFSRRNRRPPRDPVNACLSLGYTLLHFEAVVACHSAGLDPFLGLYHEPAYGRESLASDVIEPLRPHIDEWVWQLFRDRVLNAKHFAINNEAVMLRKTGRQHFYSHFHHLSLALRRLLRKQALTAGKRFEKIGKNNIELAKETEHSN